LTLNNEFKLDDASRHHAVGVLRLHKNSSPISFNGGDYDYTCAIVVFTKKVVGVKITYQIKAAIESPLTTNLLLGISKSSHMDYAVAKIVETGATNIYPC